MHLYSQLKIIVVQRSLIKSWSVGPAMYAWTYSSAINQVGHQLSVSILSTPSTTATLLKLTTTFLMTADEPTTTS